MLRGQLKLDRFNKVSLARRFDLIGFIAPEGELLSFARPRQLLLHCSTSCIHAVEKKVTKEKAARLPLASCAPRFRRGLPKGTPVPLATRGFPAAPLRAILGESSGARRKLRCSAKAPVLGAANGMKPSVRNISEHFTEARSVIRRSRRRLDRNVRRIRAILRTAVTDGLPNRFQN
jgi:hypothetical protein